MKIELRLPLRDIYITQPFGVNYLDFYKKMGLDGHNGIDFRTRTGTNIYAEHDGFVHWAGRGRDGGLGIMLYHSNDTFGTMYYHNQKNVVKTGQKVKAGQLIAKADNTGKYTTGNHLHKELYLLKDGKIINRNNGYNGRIDSSKYYAARYDGSPIKAKDYDKSNAYHRYGRKKSYLAEYYYRFTPLGIDNKWTRDGKWVQRQLRRLKMPLLRTEQVNAILYGGWGFEDVINPSMRELWGWLKKTEYKKGLRSFE